MYFKSSYTVLVNTGQAHSASNLFAEMQKYFVAARGVFPAAKAFPRLHILLPILNNNNLLLSVLPFTSSAFQAAVNASVLTAQLGKPRHISAGGFPCHLWLWDFVYCHMHQVLAQVFPTAPYGTHTCGHQGIHYPTQGLALISTFGFFSYIQNNWEETLQNVCYTGECKVLMNWLCKEL